MRDKSKNTVDDTDAEDITPVEKEPDDITSPIVSMGPGTIKTVIFLFILFILLHSDVFIDRILASPDNSYVEGREVTTKGMIVQGILLSLGYVMIHVLVECQCL